MAGVTLGIFNDRTGAESAISRLETAGFEPEDISVIMRDTQVAKEISKDTGASVAESAVSGATTGGVLGGIAGLLIGVGAIAVPGIGALLIAGPLAAAMGLTGAAATTVSGAVTGALAGGLVGALTGLGIPEETARVYESRVKEGAVLLAVPTRSGDDAEARQILEDSGAEETRVVATDKPMSRMSQ